MCGQVSARHNTAALRLSSPKPPLLATSTRLPNPPPGDYHPTPSPIPTFPPQVLCHCICNPAGRHVGGSPSLPWVRAELSSSIAIWLYAPRGFSLSWLLIALTAPSAFPPPIPCACDSTILCFPTVERPELCPLAMLTTPCFPTTWRKRSCVKPLLAPLSANLAE